MMEQQERADRTRRQNMSACMRTAREFMREEDAVGVVEIILILVGNFTPYLGCVLCG